MEEDKLLDVDEAAEILGVSKWWFYENRRWETLPFKVLLSKRKIRFSLIGINKWIREQQDEK